MNAIPKWGPRLARLYSEDIRKLESKHAGQLSPGTCTWEQSITGRTPVFRRRTEMLINTPAYTAALSQLAAALAELDPAFVHGMLEEEAGVTLLHDLSIALGQQHPAFYAKLEALLA